MTADCKDANKKLFSGRPIYKRVSYINDNPDVQLFAKKLQDDLSALIIKHRELCNQFWATVETNDSAALTDLL